MTLILQVQNVSKRFGGLQALTDINFELPEGEILGLIGPNGAGKTTLFNVINGVYRPEAGRVIFRGQDITGLPPYEVARLGLARTHQIVRPLNELSVRENVTVGACFGRRNYGLAEAQRIADDVLICGGNAIIGQVLCISIVTTQPTCRLPPSVAEMLGKFRFAPYVSVQDLASQSVLCHFRLHMAFSASKG